MRSTECRPVTSCVGLVGSQSRNFGPKSGALNKIRSDLKLKMFDGSHVGLFQTLLFLLLKEIIVASALMNPILTFYGTIKSELAITFYGAWNS